MLTLETLRAVCPNAKSGRLAVFIQPLEAAMAEFDVSTPARQAAFLGQIAHESGEFRYVAEIADGVAYDNREDLGNTRPEAIDIAAAHGSSPGQWWKGHGLIQITGFDNHAECSTVLYGDRLVLLHNPRRLELPVDATRSAAWFWRSRGLNALADMGDYRLITKRINGGFTHYAERVAYYARAQQVLHA